MSEHQPKVVFLTSPNNPDGSMITEVRGAGRGAGEGGCRTGSVILWEARIGPMKGRSVGRWNGSGNHGRRLGGERGLDSGLGQGEEAPEGEGGGVQGLRQGWLGGAVW